jgi:pimeloyl-ACP methyl ester carboxylesterase
MTATALVHPENSTIVRPYIDTREAALRFGEPPAVVAPRVPEVAGYETQRSTLRSGSHELAIYQWGSGSRAVGLLAHGFGGSAAQMVAFVPGLLAAGYRVVAFDQPAHGFTPGRYAHLVDFAEHITRVSRAFGASAVVAHSLGATATLIAHARGLSLERAVLIAPPANVEHFATAFADHAGLPREELPEMLAHVERDLGYPLGLLDVRNLAGLMDGAPADLLVLHDPADAEVPYEHGRTLAAHWPGARLETLRGVGHRRVLRDALTATLAVAHLTHHA